MAVDPQRLVQGLAARGMPRNAAIGFVGNFGVESRYDPGINEINPLVEGSRGGFGFSQWTGPRRRQLEAFARDRGMPVSDEDTQLDFLMWELDNTETRARDKIYAAETVEDAARLVSESFLRPGIPHLDRRIQEASRIAGGAGDTQLTGQQGGDTIATPTVTPSQAANVYQAYISGQMSDEQAAAYQADVAAGRMIVPEGVSLEAPAAEPAQVANPIVNLDPSVVANVYNAYASGQMSPEQAAAYTSDVQSGIMQLPEGATLEAQRDPLTPSADTDTRTTAEVLDRGDTRFAPDLTRQYAAESGGDLARQAAAGLTGSGPSPSAQMLPEGTPGVVTGIADAGLAALGGLGAIGGAAAGAVGDFAEAAGVPRAPQLARDLAAIPEALAGSPVAMAAAPARAARRATPDAPNLPATQSPAAVLRQPPQATQAAEDAVLAAPRQLTQQESNEMRSLISRAANNNTSARNRLAEMAAVDPEAAAAAQRLGIEAPVDVFATNAGVQQAAGIVRAVRGSDASAEWQDTFEAAQRRASEIIEGQGGSRDLAANADRVRDSLTASTNELRSQGSAIFESIRERIPTGTRVSPDASTRAINGVLEDLGGPESLTPPVKSLFNAITSEKGMTYGRLMQERQQIGRAISKNQGPYADADSYTLGQLYSALGDDQSTFIRTTLGDDAAADLANANQLWSSAKDLEDRMVQGFGRDQEGSIANTLRSALTNASRGDAGKLNRVLNVVPEDLQRETILTGISSLSEARSGQGGFSFAQYAKTYRGLRDNGPVFQRLAGVLGEDTNKIMRDLYEVSIRMDRASQNVPRTGQSNQALIADGLLTDVMNSSVGRTARGMAAGVAGSAVGGPALGSLAAVGASSTKVGKNRAEAVSRLFRDPAFQKLAQEAAATGAPSPQTIQAARSSSAFRRWAGVNNIESPDTWLVESLARAGGTQSNESE